MLIDKSLKPNYYLITLLTIDPDDITKSKMLELDPETIEAGVFMDKECKIPAPISDPRYHLKPGEHEILSANPEEGGYIKLNADGYIPFQYLDKHVLALWFEFENTAEMLANNDYNAVKHHGHLVMVHDYSDDPRIEHPLGRMWAIYRLEGNNPRDINSWHMIFYEAWFREYIHWEDIPKDIQSTVQQIDEMVAHSHQHFAADTLEKFGVDAEGNLTFNGIRLTLRKDIKTINIITKYPYNELLVGDMGHEILYRGEYQPTSDHDSDGRPYLVGDVSGYYEDNTEIREPKPINVTNADKMNRFFKNCTSLERIPFMDVAFVQEMDEFCRGCTRLTSVASMRYDHVTTMAYAFSGCLSLSYLPSMNLNECTNVAGMFNETGLIRIGEIIGSKIEYAEMLFADCPDLEVLPKIDLSKAYDLTAVCYNCKSLTSAKLDTGNAVSLNIAFAYCENLESVEIDMSKCISANQIFDGCTNLDHVVIKGDIRVSLDFTGTKINLADATNIVNSLPETDKHLSITLTGTPGSKVNSVSVAKAERKGWTIIR